MSEAFQQFLSSQCPAAFPADFHHQLREKLCFFPRYLPASFGSEQQRFWPDLNTFTEDHQRFMLMYYPQQGCESVCVVFRKTDATWEVIKFIGAGADGAVRGAEYAEVLFAAACAFTTQIDDAYAGEEEFPVRTREELERFALVFLRAVNQELRGEYGPLLSEDEEEDAPNIG